MELPIPTHLQKILVPLGKNNSENEVNGKIKCPCGSELFEVHESNERQLIKLVCKQCGKEFLLFDAGKHGWNGFVCGDDFLDRSLPLQKYFCECGEDVFDVNVIISSQGKQDFIDECADDDSFSPDDWVNAFDWIAVSLCCKKCGSNEENWLELETM